MLIRAGRVKVNGLVHRDPARFVNPWRDRIKVDGKEVKLEKTVYLMLNKPRSLVTTVSDEQGRATVFDCLGPKQLENPSADRGAPSGISELPKHVFPVGRLDKASEGLLLFTNDTSWAARVTAPGSRIQKTYHVQVNCMADELLTHRIEEGVMADGEILSAKRVSVLRIGTKNSWIEIVLDEGKNRHIRRLLTALNIGVLRLVRVAIGSLPLGDLAKGDWRYLTSDEIRACLSGPAASVLISTARPPHSF